MTTINHTHTPVLYDQSIDRMTCRQRPSGKNSGTQKWRDLLFMHWEIPIPLAQSLLPAGLELDLYDGKAWIAVVPFAMYDVKPSFLPSWMAFNFLECNVRLYVIAASQPGVYFLSLEAASWLAVQAARIGWKLPYFYAHMQAQINPPQVDPIAVPSPSSVASAMNPLHSSSLSSSSNPSTPSNSSVNAPLAEENATTTIDYHSRRKDGVGLDLSYQRSNTIIYASVGSVEFFFLERYLLFVQRGQHIYSGQVYHTPYPIMPAELSKLDQNLTASHGCPLTQFPAYVHASPGVDVEVFALEKMFSLP